MATIVDNYGKSLNYGEQNRIMFKSRYQFSLRTLMLVVTGVAIILGIYEWYVTREDYLYQGIYSSFKRQDYKKALELANEASIIYPKSERIKTIKGHCDIMNKIMKEYDELGYSPTEQNVCYDFSPISNKEYITEDEWREAKERHQRKKESEKTKGDR